MLKVPAVAMKVADAVPAAILSDAGVVSIALLSETVTIAPPAGAAALRVTVHVLVDPAGILVGLHCSEETTTVVTTFSVAVCVVPA